MVKTELPMQEAQVRFLLRELRTHMLNGMAKKKKKKFQNVENSITRDE